MPLFPAVPDSVLFLLFVKIDSRHPRSRYKPTAPTPTKYHAFQQQLKVVYREGLVDEQAAVLRSVAKGEKVFFTGAAGTGTSKLVHAIKQYLRGLGAHVDIVAPTGIAAINVEGVTIHTYAALGWQRNQGNIARSLPARPQETDLEASHRHRDTTYRRDKYG